jgi:CHAD domain-containing protein
MQNPSDPAVPVRRTSRAAKRTEKRSEKPAGETEGGTAPVAEPVLMLVKRLDECWSKYRTELRRTRRDFADEYVHDLRVSIRRLIVALEMARAVIHQKRLKKSRRLLKSQLDAFDALRDTQVQLTIIEELQEEFPETAPYCDYLREREKRLVSRLQKSIKDFHSGGLTQQVSRLHKSLLDKNFLEAEAAIWAVVDEAYSIVLQRHYAVRADDTLTIHRLRLAFKKFRYMVECIHPLLPGLPDDFLRRLHDYQAAMGDIQDLEIGLQMLAEFTAKAGMELSAVNANLNEMHQAHILTFIDDMNEVKTFWRSAPDKKFPWQSKKHTTQRKARNVS